MPPVMVSQMYNNYPYCAPWGACRLPLKSTSSKVSVDDCIPYNDGRPTGHAGELKEQLHDVSTNNLGDLLPFLVGLGSLTPNQVSSTVLQNLRFTDHDVLAACMA